MPEKELQTAQMIRATGVACPCCWLFVVLLVFSMIPHSAFATVIRLREKVAAPAALISLGDVAEISETDEQTAAQLKRITIAPAPIAGRSVRINIDRIRRELTLRGVNQSGILFIGPSESLVGGRMESRKSAARSQSYEIKKAQGLLVSSIKNYISFRAPELGLVHIDITDEQMQLLLSQYEIGSSVNVQGGQQPWTGVQKFHVSFLDQQRQTQRFSLVCNVSIKQQVLALKLGLPRGKVIREDDLVWIDSGDSADAGLYFSKPEDLVGTETVRNIRAQRPVGPEDIRQLPLVKRNDIVAVTARIGGVIVRRYCKSHDEGTKGQFVTLTPVDGNKKVTARVTGFREAEIAFDNLQKPVQNKAVIPVSPVGLTAQSSNQGLQIIRPQASQDNGRYEHHRAVSSANVAPVSREARYSSRRLAPGNGRFQIRARILANRPVQIPQHTK